jgi:hypothetical protein
MIDWWILYLEDDRTGTWCVVICGGYKAVINIAERSQPAIKYIKLVGAPGHVEQTYRSLGTKQRG